MRTLIWNHLFKRVGILALALVLMVTASWWFAVNDRSPAIVFDPIASDSVSRTGASLDAQIVRLQEQLRANPQDWQSYSQLGVAFLQKARETGDPTYYQRTEEALDQALAIQPDDYVSISGKGALALARHDFFAALEWGEQARQINPDRTYAYGVVADAQVELGRYKEAIATLQTMVDLRPDMSSYSRISYIRELHGDTEGALEMMQLAVESGLPGGENTAWVRTQLANLYFNSGDLEGAEQEYQRTLQNKPGYVHALAGLGRVRAAQDRPEEAIRYLQQAINTMPMPEFVISLGELYQSLGREAQAQQQYDLLATIETLHRANGVDMDMEIALFNADHDRNLQDTVRLAREAYARRPSIQGADVLSWALYKTGAYEEAQIYSEEALQLGTQDSLKLFHAGMIALELGDKAQAREYLEEAIAINPHFSTLHAEQARTLLETLK